MKKLQVFISSTFEDLKAERQAAVQAVLRAQHIPAGMELFTAGDETQWKVIQRWIENSDVFLLILGSRYGSTEPKGGLSYIEREFDHALKLDKPLFSIVMSDEELRKRRIGVDTKSFKPHPQYVKFRRRVTSKMCEFFSDLKDIQLAIHRKLPELLDDSRVSGWVSAKEIVIMTDVIEQAEKLKVENTKLVEQIRMLEGDDKKVRRVKFLNTDYVKHLVEKHGITSDSCLDVFTQARNIDELGAKLRAVSPRTTTCEFLQPKYMKYEFLGMINLARNSLGLDCFNRAGEADPNITDTYLGLPDAGTRERSLVESSIEESNPGRRLRSAC